MSTRRKTTDQQLYLLVTEDRSHGYYHLTARVRTQKYDQLEHQHAPMHVDDEYRSGFLYSSLQLTAQGDTDSQKRASDKEPVYGWTLEYYEPYRCDLYQVRRMAKTLETLHKRLSKIQERRGYQRSFGEYCGRLAEVLGCEGIVIENTSRHSGCGLRWSWLSIGDGVNRVNNLVYQWQQEAEPKPAPAPAAVESGEEQAS